jgi:hypothetical protein
MYKPSTYLVVAYFSYLYAYIWNLLPAGLVTKMKPNINSVEFHPQLSTNGHPVDGALVGAGSLWPYISLISSHQVPLPIYFPT